LKRYNEKLKKVMLYHNCIKWHLKWIFKKKFYVMVFYTEEFIEMSQRFSLPELFCQDAIIIVIG
jgi:hypothetical protein